MKVKKGKDHVKKTRKQMRKQERVQKKSRKNEFFQNRTKTGSKPPTDETLIKSVKTTTKQGAKSKDQVVKASTSNTPTMDVKKTIQKEKREMQKLKKQMLKHRKKQMFEANLEEDRNIKKLEKQLKLNKRKSKSLPKSFANDGLDYLLEVCDSDNLKDIVSAEMGFNDINDDFEEDFALMAGKSKKFDKNKKGSDNKKRIKKDAPESDLDDLEDFSNASEESEEESFNKSDLNMDFEEESDIEEEQEDPFDFDEDNSEDSSDNEEDFNENPKISKENPKISKETPKISNDEEPETMKAKKNEDGTWQDIYGRSRDKDGNIISEKENQGKYVPPAIRAQTNTSNAKLLQLKRQVKGLINRLAESNMHSISNQLENLYMSNSRNDMNETLTDLILDSLIGNVSCPERLLLEHVVLITVLHANVGSEVGAHFLQTCVHKFHSIFQQDKNEVGDKTLDNLVNVIAQLYNFKIFGSNLLYDILSKLATKFEEKHVECILNVLRNVGFTLRKEDPLILKELISNLQKQASLKNSSDNPRIKFMLEILLAIKNNNVNKIPNYDTSYSEHLKKILKSFIRKGNYVTQLNIGLDDLLKVDERGKWWVIGSAWTGKEVIKESKEENMTNEFSQKLLALARKQRMNTDTRKNIFCIIMSAEDFMDAFEKLLHLGLKNQQEREIINVILHCCLREKQYNPYYSYLAQKFCDYERRFQMTIKYSIWDKVKALGECSTLQISNLAKLLTHLFLEKGLPISTLKIVQFSELDKISARFLRQIFLGILLADRQQCLEVFERVSLTEKTKMFRESLRLFIHHFLLRNLHNSEQGMDEGKKNLLEERAKMVEKLLIKSAA